MSQNTWTITKSDLEFKICEVGYEFHLYIDNDWVFKYDPYNYSGSNMPECPLINELVGDEQAKEIYEYFGNKFHIYLYGNQSLMDKLLEKFDTWLANQIYYAFEKTIDSDKKFEYIDNYRFAKVGDIVQEKEYKKQAQKGCCGSYDTSIEIEGIKYNIGFNFGH